jgi:hypothetical protein
MLSISNSVTLWDILNFVNNLLCFDDRLVTTSDLSHNNYWFCSIMLLLASKTYSPMAPPSFSSFSSSTGFYPKDLDSILINFHNITLLEKLDRFD